MLSQQLADRELVSLYLDVAQGEEVDLEVAAMAAIEWAIRSKRLIHISIRD